jgi:putative phosphoesterase
MNRDAMRIGLLTDTHLPSDRRTLWDEVAAAFAGVDLILHGGDIVHPMVLDWLEQIAPVLAARGNNDGGWGDPRMQDRHIVEAHGWRVAMVHDMEPEERPIEYLRKHYLGDERVDVIVTGHTHFERMDYRDGVLQVNSGSPTHPHLWSTRLGTVGLLHLESSGIEARIVRLGETPGLRNPGLEYAFTPAAGVVSLR